MKLEVKGVKNYCATIVSLDRIVPHPDPEIHSLAVAILFGNQIVIGKDTPVGTVGVYFVVESKISGEYLKHNNLYRDKTLNRDQNKKGFFEISGRVKALRLRQVPSCGFFMPLESFLGLISQDEINQFKVGDEFDTINGNKVCEKYILEVKNTPSQGGNKKGQKAPIPRESRLIDDQFRLHIDTDNLRKNMWKVKPNDMVSITSKWHGCVEFNTVVETENGPMKIGDVVEGKINTKILARDVVANKNVFVPIDDFYKKENDGEWLEIGLDDGRTIQITTNNPVWLPLINAYREAGDLKVGDTLLVN